MPRSLFSSIVFALFLIPSFAQRDSVKAETINYQMGFRPELFYNGSQGASLGGVIGKNIGTTSDLIYFTSLNADFLLGNDTLAFGPRLNATILHKGIAGLGIDIASYYRGGKSALQICPQLYFSWFGLINLSFGYSYNVKKFQPNEFSQFRVGLSFNLVRKER